ncbi:unnamed protein product [Caenorhabditis sp. 36 PRJEB53466]|nr:unnamed protein product [Caenorhabditis sp. 36 PRJEB53466]
MDDYSILCYDLWSMFHSYLHQNMLVYCYGLCLHRRIHQHYRTTCCVGTPMVINNWYHCGPLSANYNLTCCPTGGYWATWSAWQKLTDQIAWTRSRTCLSGGYSCACTGDSVETKYTCPCSAISVITTDSNPCSTALPSLTPFSVRTPVNLGSQCQSMFVLEASNFRYVFYTADTDGTYYTSVGVVNSGGTCTAVKFYNGTTGTNGQFYKFYFTCNPQTGYFDGTYQGTAMTNVTSIAQFY